MAASSLAKSFSSLDLPVEVTNSLCMCCSCQWAPGMLDDALPTRSRMHICAESCTVDELTEPVAFLTSTCFCSKVLRENSRSRVEVHRRPLGVAAAIVPW